jgi:hypothetical protein
MMNEDAWIGVSAVILRIWGSVDEHGEESGAVGVIFDCRGAVIDPDPT